MIKTEMNGKIFERSIAHLGIFPFKCGCPLFFPRLGIQDIVF